MTTLMSTGQVGAWIWFGVAWAFIFAVMLKRWFARERRDAAHTRAVMNDLGHDTSGAHIWDAS